MLPDGVTHTKGYVKNPDEAQRYLALTSGDPPVRNKDFDELQVTETPENRKKTDLTKNVVEFLISLKKLVCHSYFTCSLISFVSMFCTGI